MIAQNPLASPARAALAAATFVAVAATGSAQPPAAASWRTDAEFLIRELPRRHAAPWLRTPQATFDSAARVLLQRDATFPLHRAVFELTRLVAMFGNGHTELQLFSGPNAFTRMPVRFYRFDDTLRVMSASAEHRDLLGARVIRLGSMPTTAALRAIEPYLAHDNGMEFMHQAPVTLASPEVLHALGATSRADSAELTFELEDGRAVRRVLPGVRALFAPESRLNGVPRAWSAPDFTRRQWYTIRADIGVAYYRVDLSSDVQGQPTIAEVTAGFFRAVDSAKVSTIVIDVRDNSGGNRYRNVPIINGIEERSRFRSRGALFVVTGRVTYSAAVDLVRGLLRVAEPIIVGERSRGDPRQTGNREALVLPTTGFPVDYTDEHEIVGTGTSPFLPLDIPAPPTFASMIRGADPAIEAIVSAIRRR